MSVLDVNRSAFVRVVEANANAVTAVALAIVRDIGAAQDIAQDAFLIAWRDAEKLRSAESAAPWLLQITRNRSYEWLRTKREAEPLPAVIPDRDASIAEVLERREQQRIIDEVIEALPEDAREVITLYYREGCSVRQVAERLDLSEEVVKKRMSRARDRIREEVLERFGETVRTVVPVAMIVSAVASLIAATSASAAATGAATANAGAIGTMSLGSSLLGLPIGAMSSAFTIATLVSLARDDEEKRAINRLVIDTVLLNVVAMAGYILAARFNHVPLLIYTHVFWSTGFALVWTRMLPFGLRNHARLLAGDPWLESRLAQRRLASLLLLGFLLCAAMVPVLLTASRMSHLEAKPSPAAAAVSRSPRALPRIRRDSRLRPGA